MKVRRIITIIIIVTSLFITNLSIYQRATAENINNKEAILDGTQPIKPWDYQKLLGKGMDVDWCKTSKGMKNYSTIACKNFKMSGISHVRIRIKNYISDTLFQSLDKQIDDCIENGLIPIVAYQANEFKNAPTEENIQKVVDWWKAVAERYKNKSYFLAFDLLIEATDVLNKQPEKLNEIYGRIIPEIRKTNPERILMISPRLRSDAAYLHELKIPEEHNGYLMAEWHFYAAGPSKTTPRKLWTTGTEAEKKLITDKIELALKWQEENNVPTWVGAWMAGNYNDGNHYTIQEQVNFATFMSEQLTKAGIPFAVNSDTKFYDREKNIWIEDLQPVFECIYGQKAVIAEINSTQNNTTDTDISDFKINKKINVGFNVKGNLDTVNQCKYFEEQLVQLKNSKVDTDKIYLRLQGGTISQKSYSKNWSNKQISLWVQLQKKYKCKYIFVINFNDTAANQLKFYQRFLKAGIKFCMLELGNEQYLPRFAKPYTVQYDEITKRTANMTASKYIKLSNTYIKLFKKYKLPFYVQFAPDSENNRTLYEKWNTTIINAINNKEFASTNIHGSIHLYERKGAGSLNVEQINSLRKRTKNKIHIAVTESGVTNKKEKLTEDDYASQELNLEKRILMQLKPGDTLLNQVLYTDYKTTGSAVLHPQSKGLTKKGQTILELFKQFWLK